EGAVGERVERAGRQAFRLRDAAILLRRGDDEDRWRLVDHRDDRDAEADLEFGLAVHPKAATSIAKGSPSKASAPRPMPSIAATMRPSRRRTRSARATRRGLGVAE